MPINSRPVELVRFLLARIDDDEALVKKLVRRQLREGVPADPNAAVSAERLRIECQSKRQLIGTLQQLFVLRDQPLEKPVRDAAAQMLQALALPYSAHIGYRDAWGGAERVSQPA